MKGGTFTALVAVIQLAKAGIVAALPITFLFTRDEEIGSTGTGALIEAEARRHKYILVPRPQRACWPFRATRWKLPLPST